MNIARTIGSFMQPLVFGLAGLMMSAGALRATAERVIVGDPVPDFEMVNRRAWTNDLGRVVPPGAPLRLSDFAGKIVFIQFFYAW